MNRSTPAASSLGKPQPFRDWSHGQPLAEALARAESEVRAKPQASETRWLLFELLCVLGHWERALKQLQHWAALKRDHDSSAHVMRSLIRAEHQRTEVLNGRASPATLGASGRETPAWVAGLGDALKLAANGDAAAVDAADRTREAALAQAPDVPGASNLQASFDWITDSDSRIGPVCELIVAGVYRWLPFTDLKAIRKPAPGRLLDLVWAQVELQLCDGTPLSAYMPMRYPARAGDRDALLLARETVWSDVGRTGVVARGQKMWTTDSGDMALLDLRDATFQQATAPAGDADEKADAGKAGP